jgi:hypothetical protein
MATFQDLQKAYPEWETFDEAQEDRIEKLKLYAALTFLDDSSSTNLNAVLKQEERERPRRRGLLQVYIMLRQGEPC